MPGPAQVRSSEAIEVFSLALARFAERVGNALDVIDADLRRADDWIDHDRPSYWRKTIHEAEDAVHQAKLDVERCLLMTTVDGQRPACREQRAALQQAKVRLDYCREKLDLVKKWQRNFRHDSMEYKGRVGQLRWVVEHDVPAARGVLTKIVHHVEQYQLEKPPEAMSGLDSQAAPIETMTKAPVPAASSEPPEEP
jgi:hypothetical protein